jgi:hypothetical protein
MTYEFVSAEDFISFALIFFGKIQIANIKNSLFPMDKAFETMTIFRLFDLFENLLLEMGAVSIGVKSTA